MNIDIKKFAIMSAITIEQSQEQDITTGILDILSYVSIIETASNLSGSQYDQRKNNVFRSEMFFEQTDISLIKKKIIFKNAPLLGENYFNVPALIVRKS